MGSERSWIVSAEQSPELKIGNQLTGGVRNPGRK